MLTVPLLLKLPAFTFSVMTLSENSVVPAATLVSADVDVLVTAPPVILTVPAPAKFTVLFALADILNEPPAVVRLPVLPAPGPFIVSEDAAPS